MKKLFCDICEKEFEKPQIYEVEIQCKGFSDSIIVEICKSCLLPFIKATGKKHYFN